MTTGARKKQRLLLGLHVSRLSLQPGQTRSQRDLAGDYSDLLPCDGISVVLERDALKGYGNAIVPQVAAEFIRACEEARSLIRVA